LSSILPFDFSFSHRHIPAAAAISYTLIGTASDVFTLDAAGMIRMM
jgi:hypothetical protein